LASAFALHSADVSIPILSGRTPGNVHSEGTGSDLFKIAQAVRE
jgi:hypothetical protein